MSLSATLTNEALVMGSSISTSCATCTSAWSWAKRLPTSTSPFSSIIAIMNAGKFVSYIHLLCTIDFTFDVPCRHGSIASCSEGFSSISTYHSESWCEKWANVLLAGKKKTCPRDDSGSQTWTLESDDVYFGNAADVFHIKIALLWRLFLQYTRRRDDNGVRLPRSTVKVCEWRKTEGSRDWKYVWCLKLEMMSARGKENEVNHDRGLKHLI